MSRRQLKASWTLGQLRRLAARPAAPELAQVRLDARTALLQTRDPEVLCGMLLDAILGEPPF